MDCRRQRWTARRKRTGRRARLLVETLERRFALDGTGQRPFIDLGASDNVALDQPRVTVEFGDASGRSIGPDIFNSWLLDTGANTILAFKTAIDDMNESPPPYQVEGLFNELGVGGSQLFDISAPYRLDFAGTSGVRQTIVDTRIISDATRDVSMFGPFGIVGMPAMTGRVTTLDFTPWLTFAEGNFLMAADFSAELPAPAGPRYSISVDDRVSFSPEGEVIAGDHAPVWADIPFFTAEVHHGSRVVTGNFMFDTGAQVTIISTATAMALGLDSNGDGVLDATDTGYTRTESVGGVGGSREAPVYMIDAVHLPTDQGIDLTWSELQWLVVDIAPGIDGVFGFDNMTSGWIDATFSSGGAGYLLQSHLDFRGWDETGVGKIHFDLNPELAAIQNPTGAGAVIVEPGGTTTVSESGIDDSYFLALRQRPTADVLVDLVVRPRQLTASSAAAPQTTTLRFTPDTWDIPQAVVVHAVDDVTEQSLHRSSVRHVARSADPAYDGVGLPSVLVNIVDNDFPAVMILPTDGQTDVTEGGGSDTYSLVLMRQPTGDVTITPTPADGQIRAVSAFDGSARLVFTPATWNLPQAVRVTAVDDTVVEGRHSAYVNHVISTSDAGYSEAYALPEVVFIADNDAPAATSLTATPGSGQVRLAYSTPIDTGGLPISDYVVEVSTDGGAGWRTVADAVSASATTTITGLVNGTPYAFRVAAVNAIGRGPFTPATPAAIPALPAGLPTALRVTRGNGTATLTWKPPTATGGSPIKDYALQLSSDAGRTWAPIDRPASSVTSATVTGLANGTTYVFRVAAVNSVGAASFTAKSLPVVPATTASAAPVPVVVRRSGQVNLSWSAPPSNGGLPITDYVIHSSRDGGRTWKTFPHKASPATTATVTGLANGTAYVFRVAAVNGIGIGAFTGMTDAVVPAALAGTPTAMKATRGNGEVLLAWKAPANAGGVAITNYLLQTSRDGGKTWETVLREPSTATTTTIPALVNGRSYTFRVAAVNDVGTGPFTAKSAAVVPATIPATPTALTVIRVNNRATLSWGAPLSAGGSPIIDYALQWSPDGGATWKRYGHKPSTKTVATITGLPNGISLAFRVAAVNAVGTSQPAEKTIAAG